MMRSILMLGLMLMLSVAACSGGGGGNGDGRVDLIAAIEPPSITIEVPMSGGAATLPGITSVFFPDQTFTVPTNVTISTSTASQITDIFDNTAAIFLPENRLSYEIRVNIGALPISANVESIDVNVVVPSDYVSALDSDFDIDVFALVGNDAGEESFAAFDLVFGSFSVSNNEIASTIPAAAFIDAHTLDGTYELVLVLAATPKLFDAGLTVSKQQAVRLAASNDAPPANCPEVLIQCPVEVGCTVTSNFFKNRLNGIDGTRSSHTGADFETVSGTKIHAAKSGNVLRSELSSGGLGNMVVIQHDDQSRTLYAHLQSRSVASGAAVVAGENIGVSGSSGQANTPHLHFEYVSNGPPTESKERIDPQVCLQEPDDFVGIWDITEVASSFDPECNDTSSFESAITIQDGKYVVAFPSGSTSVTPTADSLSVVFQGSYPDGGGVTSETGSGTFSDAGFFDGMTSWSWTHRSYSCGGTSVFTGTRR
jgi:murein DD-endopeptidase MepM/ murein hydrolase activator NlpD